MRISIHSCSVFGVCVLPVCDHGSGRSFSATSVCFSACQLICQVAGLLVVVFVVVLET